MLIALAASLKWHILRIEEVIFIKYSLNIGNYFDAYPDMKEKTKYFPETVIRLMNPLYGLKKAGTAWRERVGEILAKRGFHPLVTDDVIYLDPDTGDVIASYVHDFRLFGPAKQPL